MGITKGDKENSYIVHFSDSAMVSRAVARGYVTVNGADVELTEDTKQQLSKTDKWKIWIVTKGTVSTSTETIKVYYTY